MEKKERRKVEVGKIYRHFKGQAYKVLLIAKDSEDINHQLVIYQALYGNHDIYARDLTMFLSKVDKEKYPEVSQYYRFEEDDLLNQNKTLKIQ